MDENRQFDWDDPDYEDRYYNDVEDKLYEQTLIESYGYENPYEDFRSETHHHKHRYWHDIHLQRYAICVRWLS